MEIKEVACIVLDKSGLFSRAITLDELFSIKKNRSGRHFLGDLDFYFNRDYLFLSKALVSYKTLNNFTNEVKTILVFIDICNLDSIRGLKIIDFKVHFYSEYLNKEQKLEIYNKFKFCCREVPEDKNDLSKFSNEDLIKELNRRF